MLNGNPVGHKSTVIKTESYLTAAILTTTVVLWGGSNIAGKFLVRDLSPFTAAGFRIVLAFTFLVFFLRRKEGLFFPQRHDWPMLFALGLVGIFGSNILVLLALQHTTATNVGLIAAGSPIMITMFSTFMLKERISLWQVIGIILSFAGVVVVITKGSWSILVSEGLNIGDLIMLVNSICFALYTILTKKLVTHYTPLALVTFAHLVASILFVPFLVFVLTISRAEIHVSAVDVGSLVYLSVLASSIGTLLWYKGIERIGASRAGIFINGIPISTMLLSTVFLGERISWSQILGCAMVIFGVYFNSMRAKKDNPAITNLREQ